MNPRRHPGLWLGTSAALILGSQTQRIAEFATRQIPTELAVEALLLGQSLLYGVAPPHSDELALQGTDFARRHPRWIAFQAMTESLSLYAYVSSLGATFLHDLPLSLAIGAFGVLSTMMHHAGKAWSSSRGLVNGSSEKSNLPVITASNDALLVRNDVPTQLKSEDFPFIPIKLWRKDRKGVEKKILKALPPTPQQNAVVERVVATLPRFLSLLGVALERPLSPERIHFVDRKTFDDKTAGGYIQYGEIFIPADTPDKELAAILTHEIVHYISPQIFTSYRKWHGGRTGLFNIGFGRSSTSQGAAFEGFNEAFVETLSFLYRLLVFNEGFSKGISEEVEAKTRDLFNSGSLLPISYFVQIYVFLGVCEKMAAHFSITPAEMFGRIIRSQFAADGEAALWIEEAFGVHDYTVLARMTGNKPSAFKTAYRLGFDDNHQTRFTREAENGEFVKRYYRLGLDVLDFLKRQNAGASRRVSGE